MRYNVQKAVRILQSDKKTERVCYNLQKVMRITETIINRTMTKPARYNYSK